MELTVFPLGTISAWPVAALLAVIALLIVVLSKGADLVVDEAVQLSAYWGIPKILIGATVVSLGTTLPEAAISVVAAIKGQPEIALGNAVGSVICDTGLILGVATLLSPLPLRHHIVNRQGWLQFAAGCLLILSCIPVYSFKEVLTKGGLLPQFMGIFFLFLLILYLWFSIRWTKKQPSDDHLALTEPAERKIRCRCLTKLVLGIGLVLLASKLLIPVVRIAAFRLTIPQGIVSATVVAFGTSLPELMTALSAVRKQHGELAVGNVIGADILNVLFVAGASASVTGKGLLAPPHFFTILFPAMFFLLVLFRVAVLFSGSRLKRSYGAALLGAYLLTTYVSYAHVTM